MILGDAPVLLGDMDFEERNHGRGPRNVTQRSFDLGKGDVAEDDLPEVGPEATPPTGEGAGARGGDGASESGKDEEE